jgi:hypothetical protein
LLVHLIKTNLVLIREHEKCSLQTQKVRSKLAASTNIALNLPTKVNIAINIL